MALIICHFSCIVFWCACILTIIYLFDLLTKRIKTSKTREVAMYVLFILSYITQIAIALIVFSDHMIRKFSHFQAFSINLIFQGSKHAVTTLLSFFPDAFGTALPKQTLGQYVLLLCWWVWLVKSECVKIPLSEPSCFQFKLNSTLLNFCCRVMALH